MPDGCLETQRLLEAQKVKAALQDIGNPGLSVGNRRASLQGLRSVEVRELAVNMKAVRLMLDLLDDDKLVCHGPVHMLAAALDQEPGVQQTLLTIDALMELLQKGPFTPATAFSRSINVKAAKQFVDAGGPMRVVYQLHRMLTGVLNIEKAIRGMSHREGVAVITQTFFNSGELSAHSECSPHPRSPPVQGARTAPSSATIAAARWRPHLPPRRILA
ncbi:hypothetical protein WJX72_002112 [[Myrmecia] bisecta]|uniref:Uncharacterized protein n=1 Tax=[Myrmecia] bisecta TaxID=41462 RepID=A0AAW1PFT1_9CHLO